MILHQIYKNLISVILNNLKLIVLIIFLLLLTPKAYCVGELNDFQKWTILLKNTGLFNGCKDFNAEYQILQYIDTFKSQINLDLELLKNERQIVQYSNFVKHMCDLTQELYDSKNRSYNDNLNVVKSLHQNQWIYWYELKFKHLR